MSTIAALPMITTAPTTAPGLSSAIDVGRLASFARAEDAVNLLRTRYICEGWKIDEPAAEQALAYCRKFAEGGSALDEEQEVAAIDFFNRHGVSLDWIFRGDLGSMICELASNSRRAKLFG